MDQILVPALSAVVAEFELSENIAEPGCGLDENIMSHLDFFGRVHEQFSSNPSIIPDRFLCHGMDCLSRIGVRIRYNNSLVLQDASG